MHIDNIKLPIRFLLIIVLTLLLMVASINWYISREITVSFESESEKPIMYQVFYTQNDGERFSSALSVKQRVSAGKSQVSISLPAERLELFRLDVGSAPGKVKISSLKLHGHESLSLCDFGKFRYINITKHQIEDNHLVLSSAHRDPYIVYQEPVKLSKPTSVHVKLGIALLCCVFYSALSYTIVYEFFPITKGGRVNQRETSSNQSLDTTLRTKDRMVAPDIVRLMAAFGIMYGHLGGYNDVMGATFSEIARWKYFLGFGSMDGVFFILSGFFVCRNITWKKALYNAWWCFLALTLWNFLTWLSLREVRPMMPPFYECFGISYILLPCIPFIETSNLANAPLWFMRDLVFLFLLSPILAKYARYIFPALLLLSVFSQCAPHFMHGKDIHQVCLRPYTLAYFSAGCFLASLSVNFKKMSLSYYSTGLITVYLICSIMIFYYLDCREFPLLRGLVGAWMLYQVARWLEEHVSGIKVFATKLAGPTTFLAYAVHSAIYSVWLKLALNSTGFREFVTAHGWLVLTCPFLIFGVVTLFFLAMKRWCRPLLHLVCYYKLRPDDLKPAETAEAKEPSS